MSFFKTFGHWTQELAPVAAFTPLGLLGAGGIAAAGRAMQGHSNLKDLAGAGVRGAAEGYGARGLASLAGYGQAGASHALPGITNSASSAPGVASVTIPSSAAGASVASTLTPPPAGVGSAAHNLLGSLSGHGMEAAMIGGQAASGLASARQQGAALDFQKQQYQNELARQQRVAELLAPLFRNMAQGSSYPMTGGLG